MKRILFVISVVFLTSCAWTGSNSEYTPNSDIKYPAKQANALIEVYRSSFPEKKYKEIGFITVSPGGTATVFSQPDVFSEAINMAKQMARNNGGDALIDIRQRGGGIALIVTATVIKWEE